MDMLIYNQGSETFTSSSIDYMLKNLTENCVMRNRDLLKPTAFKEHLLHCTKPSYRQDGGCAEMKRYMVEA